MSTPLGEKTLATVTIPLDHLATDLDPGREGLLQGGQRHRAARYLLARHQNVWSSSGASMPCSLASYPATTMVSLSMTLAERVRQPVRRLNVKIATRPVARRPSIRLPLAARSVPEHRWVEVTVWCAEALQAAPAYAWKHPPQGGRHDRGPTH